MKPMPGRQTIKKICICIPVVCFAILLCTAAAEGAEKDKPVPEEGRLWGSTHEVRCRENNASCCLLQMVMMGEFAALDVEDLLYLRIYTAVFTQLREIDTSSFLHLEEEFGCEHEEVMKCYDIALRNCLYADLLFREQSGEALSDADLVWLLFLEAAGSGFDEKNEEQIERIRAEMTDDVIRKLSQAEGVSEEFTTRVIQTAIIAD